MYMIYIYTYDYVYIYIAIYVYIIIYIPIYVYTSGTAQGGGGSFTIGNLYERLFVVNHGWQSAPTDGSKGGWSVGPSICPSIYLSI